MVVKYLPFIFKDGQCSEFKSYNCVKVLSAKRDKFAYGQYKILPQPKKIYTGMPVTPVTNSRYGPWQQNLTLKGLGTASL